MGCMICSNRLWSVGKVKKEGNDFSCSCLFRHSAMLRDFKIEALDFTPEGRRMNAQLGRCGGPVPIILP